MKNLLPTLLFFFFIVLQSYGQKWISVDNNAYRTSEEQRLTIPKHYESYELNFDNFIKKLETAPKRFESSEEGILINWPMPNKELQQFRVMRSDVFHPDLAAKYPKISAYTGHSLTDPTAILKISVSHKGIEGMLLSNRHETMYLDRFLPKSKNQYILYKRSDYHRDLLEGEGQCTVIVPDDGYVNDNIASKFGDCQLRKFRLALACTGEYATFHGGNVPDVLAEYNASLVRVNGIYERDFTITMELVPETDQVIFLDAVTDPYTNDSGGSMLGQNQSTCDQIIGFENYDIGHVYSTGGGGVANLRSPCTASKARGVTGLNNPTGDFFWVDYVAHEMGHQFGGNHTFNNSCGNNRNSSTAIEPGSGATIMAYAGICAPNVQNNSDDYFHSVSQNEVANFVVAGNGSCAEIITLDNNAPEIESITASGHVLPSSTPFMLTAEATDPDGDMVTYCWEQIDNGIATMPPVSNATDGPVFRSKDPTESPTRIFPDLLPILFGLTQTTWEVLPDADREMNFSLTVRDNHPLGGCTVDEVVSMTFTSSAGPFQITAPNVSTTWNAGDSEIITWDVANTDMAPVSCENVDILFSSDRGENFDIVIAENVPNDGEHEINVPFVFTSQGRIMLKCSSSIFFDINDSNINIKAPFATDVSPSDVSTCPNQMVTYMIDYTVFGDDPVPVTFSLEGLPIGATHTFSPEQIDTDTMVTLSIENLTSDLAGDYELEIIATGEMVTQTQNVSLVVAPDQNSPVTAISPLDAQTGVSNSPILSWEKLGGIESYEIEVSDNPNFEVLVYSGTVDNISTIVNELSPMSVYYWRVRGNSPCIDPSWFGVQSFQTSGKECLTEMLTANVIIPSDAIGTVESEIVIVGLGNLNEISVSMNINHNYVGDLSAKLIGPNGIEADLFDQPGVPNSNFGCDGNNIVATFKSDAVLTADDFENSCNPMGNAIEGVFQPVESFNVLYDVQANGIYTLSISDSFEDDGGELIEWSLTACESIPLDTGIILKNNILQLNNTLEGSVTSTVLEMETVDPANARFTMRSSPLFGLIQKWNESMNMFEVLNIGDRFTQEDINMDMIKYVLTDVEAEGDNFLFDTEDEQLRYKSNNTFLITSSIAPLSITVITTPISCIGAADGRIDVTGYGGIPDYTYSFNGGPFETTNIFENLEPGDYILVVKDEAGTEVSSSTLTIIEPSQITYVHFIGNNEITIEADGGTGSYMYSLDGINYTTDNTIAISDGDTYRIYVKDENGCIVESFMELIYYQIGGAAVDVVEVWCKGNATGSITVSSVTGGLAPYMYQLNDETPTTENSFDGLVAGNYNVKITGSAGTSFTQMDILVTEPENALGINSVVVENTITLTGSGGTPSYVYSIDGLNFTTDNIFMDLADGEYTGTVQDSYGCEISEMSIVVNTATSNPSLDQLKLFPNPTYDNFVLSNETVINFNYEIIDITGKIVLKSDGFSNNTISVEHLTPGLFLVKVNYKDAFKVFKLSKI